MTFLVCTEQGNSKKQGAAQENISIPLLCPLTFLFLRLWITGCRPKLQGPSSDIVVELGTIDFNTVLEVVDISEPTKPVKVSETALPSKPEYYSSITVWKQFVLITTAYGVHFLDVANPATPRLLWNLPIATLSGEAVIFKDYAFFSTRKGFGFPIVSAHCKGA